MTYKVISADRHVRIRTPEGAKVVSWSDLRAAARNYGDGMDETVSTIYRELLQQARSMAEDMCREQVELEGLYLSGMYPVGTAPIADFERQWLQRCERDYDIHPSNLKGQTGTVWLDPDEVEWQTQADERQLAINEEMRQALAERRS